MLNPELDPNANPFGFFTKEVFRSLRAKLDKMWKDDRWRTSLKQWRECWRSPSMPDADMPDIPSINVPDYSGDVITGIELPALEEVGVTADPEETISDDVPVDKSVSDGDGTEDASEIQIPVDAEPASSMEVVPEEEPVKKDSPLDNKPYVKLIEDVFLLSSEVERIMEKSKDEGVKAFAEHIFYRIEEMVERNGVIPIDNEKTYDVRRHQSVPVALVPDGTEITETVQCGWCLEERVMRRAKVKVISENEKTQTEEMKDEVRN